MPFEIVRNDICNMQVDAIVNTANPEPIVGEGVDTLIHNRAGENLLKARREIGSIAVGDAAITPAFKLSASYVIHTVGPIWHEGRMDEEKRLSSCYKNALKLALENDCESIAFPLISAGNNGFPKPLALQIAINAFSEFLMEHEMHIYLVVFSKGSITVSEKLFSSIQSFIDEKYVSDTLLEEYRVPDKCTTPGSWLSGLNNAMKMRRGEVYSCSPTAPFSSANCTDSSKHDIEKLLDKLDDGFSPTLLTLIDRTGKKDSEIYKKANIDRKLFSKIRNNPDYKPSKATALAFAIALELSLEETKEFIAKAGFTLSHSSKFDVIIEYFIENKKYDMFEINETLFAFDQILLGA